MTVLVLADVDAGRLLPSTARLVAAAAELGAVDLLLDAAAAEVGAAIAGVSRVLSAPLPQTADALAQLLATLAEPYSHIVAAGSTTGRDVIPRLAALLDLMPVTDVIAILGPNRFQRPIYAGNAIETVISDQPKHLLTVRTSVFSPAQGGNVAPVEAVDADIATFATIVAELRTPAGRAELGSAQIVVSGGISLGSAENFGLVTRLADRLGAAVGATRAAVDAGYAPNDWQVGQTGKIVATDLYIGIGISGAIQHLAGIQGAKAIVAINTDPDAPLMKLADIALVGDLFEVVPALIAELDRLGVKQP